jgi:predicted DNA-binding ribbon-helix-helix protein
MTRSIRNVEIAGRRTSFRLEQSFWEAVQQCAKAQKLTVNQFITHVVQEHRAPDASMSSAVRVYLICYYRDHLLTRELRGRAA